MNDRKHELANEKVGRLLVRYSTPAVIAMFVNSLYNLVDTIFVGQGVGTLALAGLAISFPIQMIILALLMGVGIGSASLISRSLGAREQRKAEQAAGTAITITAVIGALIAVGGRIWLEPILRLFGATDLVLPYASDYMSIILIGNIFGFAVAGNHIARAEGAARVAMTSMVIGAGLNCILDPIFIFPLDMGIRGAAIATVIAQGCSAAFIGYYFTTDASMLRIRPRDLLPRLDLLPEIFKIGSSSTLQMVAGSMMAIPINAMIGRYGAEIHLAVIGVANRVMMFFMLPIYGMVQGLQPIIGFNYGARNLARVREAVKLAASAGTALSTGAFLVLMFGTRPVLRLFGDDDALVDEGTGILRILFMFMPFVGVQMVGGSLFQALGKARPAFILALLRQALILIPLVLILPRYFGISGLWAAFPFADFTSAAVTGVWMLAEMRSLGRTAGGEALGPAGEAEAPSVVTAD